MGDEEPVIVVPDVGPLVQRAVVRAAAAYAEKLEEMAERSLQDPDGRGVLVVHRLGTLEHVAETAFSVVTTHEMYLDARVPYVKIYEITLPAGAEIPEVLY